MIAANSPIAFGVSGGKDSDAAAIAVTDYLNAHGHTGPRILIHSHLGRIEHEDSLPQCTRLAEFLGLELFVVRPPNGMIERWQKRWRNNVQRYADLSCVKLILPWSTPSMRFCTSEEKVGPITAKLKKIFPRQTIVNVSGIRREESSTRARSPITKLEPKLKRKSDGTNGVNWYPILDWTVDEVFALHEERGFPAHEAYSKHGLSRVSCSLCIMSNANDLRRSAKVPYNQPVYRELVDLEIQSTFSFQSNVWLGDVAPDLLSADQRAGLDRAKWAASIRETWEASIPKGLLYVKGWPVRLPTMEEAAGLAKVRSRVAEVVGIQIRCTDPSEIVTRFDELMALAAVKKARKNGSDEKAELDYLAPQGIPAAD